VVVSSRLVVADLQGRLRDRLEDLRSHTVDVIEAIDAWRVRRLLTFKPLDGPQQSACPLQGSLKKVRLHAGEVDSLQDVFCWQGQDYLLRMQDDLCFLEQSPALLAWLDCPVRDMSPPLLLRSAEADTVQQRACSE
jgi:hypothetical protein